MERRKIMMEHRDQLGRFWAVAVRAAAFAVVLMTIAVSVSSAYANSGENAVGNAAIEKSFFSQFIIAGGPIVWFVLLPMSVVAVYLSVVLCLTIRRKLLVPVNISGEIIKATKKFGQAELSQQLSDSGDLISKAILWTFATRSQKNGRTDLQSLAAESLQQQGMKLLRKVEWLNVIGNVAPMVGLFGTVFGMIQAFNLLGIAGGQPRPDQLAAKISVALITTFWGLLVAIPALAIGSVFRTRIEGYVSQAAVETENLICQIEALSEKQSPDLPQRYKSNLAQRKTTNQPQLYKQPVKTIS